MFTDTLGVYTDDGTGGLITLYKQGVNNPADLGRFVTDDGIYTLEVRQKRTRNRKRHEMVITQRKVATDPLTSVNSEISASVGVYIDEPNIGFSDAELSDLAKSINDYFVNPVVFAPLVRGDT